MNNAAQSNEYVLYYYNEDTGDLVGVVRAGAARWKSLAAEFWADGFPVKVYDGEGYMIYSLGV